MATQKSVFRKIALSEYRSHFLQIFSSKVLIALVGFVVTPIVARLYQPSDYGLFALMTTLTLTLSFFTNLSLPVAILVTSKEKLTNLVRATFGYSIISNFCFFLLSSMFMIPFSTQLFGTEFSAAIIICSMIALGSFLITFSQIFANLNIREKAFKTNMASSKS